MRKWKIGALALTAAGAALLLSACGTIDENYLETQANYSVDINMPYATATPLPESQKGPNPIVIDSDGNVTLNDASIIEGDFQSARQQEAQTEYRSLSLGSTGIAVQALQSRLKALGYFDGDVSGLFDADTESAVKRFEQTYGTMQTGVATVRLQLKLFASSAPIYGTREYTEAVVSQYQILRPGTVGSSVYALQQRLKSLGYPLTELSGVYDNDTAQCVRLFYRAYNLAGSEVANVSMQKELYADTARQYDPSITLDSPVDAGQSDFILPDDDAFDQSSAILLGNSGTKVTQIQRRLIALGYMEEGGDTGVFDEGTQMAVNRFLQAVGHTANGMLSQDMQDFLLSDRAPAAGEEIEFRSYTALGPGDTGEEVLNLQRRLVELGYASGTPNGQYGSATVSAVKFFQQANGLTADGEASAWLQSLMYSDSVLTYRQTQEDASAQDEPVDDRDTLYFNLAAGSTGSAVTNLQERLVELGYLTATSQAYDTQTAKAVAAFQQAIGVAQTGEASASLQRYIYSNAAPGPSVRFYDREQSYTALRLGDTGDAVTRLQRRLWELGFLQKEDVEDDVGTFNEATRLAVVSAQLKMGYAASDGEAGVEFQSFLFSKFGNYLKDK